MKVMALETTGDPCGLALCDSEGLLIERTFRHRMRLSERLIGDIDSALVDAEWSMEELDCLAVDIGPGSFTGVRIGVMTAKALADALGKPIVGIDSLTAAAEECGGIWPGSVLAVIRARPGAVYACVYAQESGYFVPISEPALVTFDELGQLADAHRGRQLLVAGDALAVPKNRESIANVFSERGIESEFGRSDAPRAATVARLAAIRFSRGDVDNAIALVPLYLAPPPIDPRVEASIKAGLKARGDISC